MSKRFRITLIAAFVLVLGINLATLPHYGITWDYHHVFFGGLYHLRLPMKPEMEDHLPFTEPDPRNMWITPFGPLMTSLPVLSYHFLYDEWKLLPFDTAYLLPTVIIGTVGIFALLAFVSEATKNPLAGVLSAAFLYLYPRYFSELHINFKDTPQSVVFMVNIWLIWRLVTRRRIPDLIVAAIAFAIALNIKVNAVFILPIAGLFTFGSSWIDERKQPKTQISIHNMFQALRNTFYSFFIKRKYLIMTAYFFLALMSAFFLWAFFWDKPLSHFLYLIDFFKDNTLNIEVLWNGNWYCSAKNVPWFFPLGYLSIVTPLPTLFFVLIGILYSLFRTFRGDKFSLLLLLWFFLPLFRYMNPKIGVIDGIRHYEEVIFPMLSMAGLAAAASYQWLHATVPKHWQPRYRQGILLVAMIVLIHLVWNIVRLHPYQIAYFNELVGGPKGAMGKYDLDYWGASQKAAVDWLNANAPPNARIHIVMSADTAGKYLRPDLLQTLNHYGYDDSDYVVVLNRQSFFYRYFFVVEYMLRRKTAHIIEGDGVPMAWIYDNALGQFERQPEWWKGDDPCIQHYWHTPPPQ